MSATTTFVPGLMVSSGSSGMASHSSPRALTEPGWCAPLIGLVTSAVSPIIPWTPFNIAGPSLAKAPPRRSLAGSHYRTVPHRSYRRLYDPTAGIAAQGLPRAGRGDAEDPVRPTALVSARRTSAPAFG